MKIDDLILDFYEKRLDVDISNVAADLYVFLVTEYKRSSNIEFAVSTERICVFLRISRKTFVKARSELVDLGFVSFESIGSKAPLYCLTRDGERKKLTCKKETQKETQNETLSETQQETPPQKQTQKPKVLQNDNSININNIQNFVCKKETQNETQQETQDEGKEKRKEILSPTPPIIIENKKENIIGARASRVGPVKTKEELIADTEKRKKNFYKSLIPYLDTYGKEMLREFFDYWSEPNKSQSKMRFELEKTWALNLRLARWANHNNKKTHENNQRDNGAAERKAAINERIKELLSE